MRQTITPFVRLTRRLLRVKRPHNIIVYAGDETPEGWDASHVFENGLHTIEIAANPTRGFLTALAHEFIHAGVRENFPSAPFHGFAFQRRAHDLETRLKAEGYDVEKIFWLGVDK